MSGFPRMTSGSGRTGRTQRRSEESAELPNWCIENRLNAGNPVGQIS